MDFVATAAIYPALFHRMMGLLILLGPDIFVAGVADIGLFDLQGFIRPPVHRMAIVTRYAGRLVLAHIPGSELF